MNNLLSINWLRELVDVRVAPAELAKKLSLSGAGVEHTIHWGDAWQNIVVGKIRSLEAHPNADSLTVCKVQIGSAMRQIVCGGKNLRNEMLVAVATPGARVQWPGAGETVEITETTLRGVSSWGMICDVDEIGLAAAFPAGDKEILDLSFLGAVKNGTSLVEALQLDDIIFDVEATSNRPDLMSVMGVAREAVAVGAGKFKKVVAPVLPRVKNKQPLQVLDKKLCPRYIAVRVDNLVVGESPWWMKKRLLAAGARPINAIVDITNYVRLELGQPLHAFATPQVHGGLVVRRARAGEKFVALDDSAHNLTAENLVIADHERPLCVAGVMGGKDSGVYAGATSVIFEAASFDPVSVRKTARALNLYSDAQLLFEKGLSVMAPGVAMARALQLTKEICGGEEVALTDFMATPYKPLVYNFDFSRVGKFIGVAIKMSEMKKSLTALGFVVKGGTRAKITVPWWRDHDIENEVDFIEEIARIHGYANLPSRLPSGAPPERAANTVLSAEKILAQILVAQGFNEIMTYSFTNENVLAKAGLEKLETLRVSNPLTAEQTLMRPSLLPGILEVIAQNQDNFNSGKIFEISNIYLPRAKDIPVHSPQLIAAVWSPEKNGEQFFALKGTIEKILRELGIKDALRPLKENISQLHHGRSIELQHLNGRLGVLGEVHPQLLKNFGIGGRAAVCLVPIENLWLAHRATKTYVAPPIFPPVKRDLAIVVDERITFANLDAFFRSFNSLLIGAELFDTYRGRGVGATKKSLAWHLQYAAADRTLTGEEVETVHTALLDALAENFSAIIRD